MCSSILQVMDVSEIGRYLSPRLSTMVVEIFNANVTYSVKQLTADCVDETSVLHGFNVDNDYNIWFRTV